MWVPAAAVLFRRMPPCGRGSFVVRVSSCKGFMSDPATNPAGVSPGATSATARKPRVLIVDSSELGGLLQALFNRNEFEVVVARSGVAALDAILSQPPSVAIVELE